MAKLDELVIELTAETKQLQAALKTSIAATDQATSAMQKSVSQFSANSNQKVSLFQQGMATMAGFIGGAVVIGAFNLVKDAAKAMADLILTEGVGAAIAQENAMNQLNFALQASGRFAEGTAENFKTFADEMEATTGVADDVILKNAGLLASMTELSEDGIQEAIRAAVDFSKATGKDLDTSISLITKAANGQTDAFKKMGITIDESGGKAATFSRTMQALSQFQGAGAKSLETYSGALLKTQNSFGNLLEEIATAITSNKVVITVIQSVGKVFGDLQGYVEANKSSIKSFVGEALIGFIEAVKLAVTIVDNFARAIVASVKAVMLQFQALTDLNQAFVALVSGEGIDAAIGKFKETKEGFESLTSTLADPTGLSMVASGLGEISNNAAEALGEMNAEIDETATKQEKAVATTNKMSEAMIALRNSQAEFAKGLAETGLSFDNVFAMQQEALKNNLDATLVGNEQQLEAQTAYFEALQEAQLAHFENEQAALDAARANQLITETEYNAAKTQLAFQQAQEEMKLQTEKNKTMDQLNKKRTEDLKSTFSTIATLSSSSNKELATIGKAAAITNATIDGIAAVQKALASAPPPFNFALAAAVGAATAANVAKIAGVGLAGGIDSVPRSSRGANGGDNFPAILQPGERVVPSETNKDLTNFLQGQGGPQQVNYTITIVNNLPASREAGQIMIDTINDAIAAGALPLLGST